MPIDRFDRQVRLFGNEGQERLRSCHVAVVGTGGVGSFVAQELALLGVGTITLIDDDVLADSNRNRHVCARSSHEIGTPKATLTAQVVSDYDRSLEVRTVPKSVLSPEGMDALRNADAIFGCVDLEGVRLVLTEFSAAFEKPYLDIATGIELGPPLQVGGQMFFALPGQGCLVCAGLLDLHEARQDLESRTERADRQAIYGVPSAALDRSGPSVVCLNGVAASLGVMEFMKWRTGICPATRSLRYDALSGKVLVSAHTFAANCWFCAGVFGKREASNVARYALAREG